MKSELDVNQVRFFIGTYTKLMLFLCDMLSNAEIKMIRSLREKKFRDELGLFIVEGEKMLAEALKSDYTVERVLRLEEIGGSVMERISLFSSASPVLALVRQKNSDIEPDFDSLCLALDSVRDPGNMGTIIRIADWFGIRTIYASPDSVESYNPKVVQASMGSIFRVNIIRTSIPDICSEFRKRGLDVYGTFLDGENIYDKELGSKALIVMGNESNGISPETSSHIDSKLLIPSYGGSEAESLNVAVATALTLAEFRRQKN